MNKTVKILNEGFFRKYLNEETEINFKSDLGSKIIDNAGEIAGAAATVAPLLADAQSEKEEMKKEVCPDCGKEVCECDKLEDWDVAALKECLFERMMNEADMSDEDKADNQLLRAIYHKTSERANSKLTPEEQAVMKKYNLDRFKGDRGPAIYRKDNYGHVVDPVNWRNMDKFDKINYADRARKQAPEERNGGYARNLWQADFSKKSSNDIGREYKDEEGKYHYIKGKGLLDAERDDVNRHMTQNHDAMTQALDNRKSAEKSLANLDKDFDAKRDEIAKKYAKEIADNEQRRGWNKNWDTNKRDSANKEIDRLLKRDEK